MQRILRTRTRESRGAASPRSGEGDEEHRKTDRHEVRRQRDAAAGIGSFGRTRFDAGHDGHHPQPGYERPGRGSRSQAHGQSPFRMGLVPPFRTDVRRRGAGHEARFERGARSVRGVDRCAEREARREKRHRPDDRRPEGAGAQLQGSRKETDRRGFPGKSLGSALGRYLRRIRFVDERACHPLPQAQQHSGGMGHGRIGTGDGIRQHGRQLGDRRSLLARRSNG
ncbi:unknown [Alistipes putredinis CAG:67]|nr:unknown [Alistipes putredinis CAG:67]